MALNVYIGGDAPHNSPDRLGGDTILSDGMGTGGRIVARGDQPELVRAIHLAGAAPDLLEACKRVVDECDRGTHDAGTMGMARLRAAIAKAEGGK